MLKCQERTNQPRPLAFADPNHRRIHLFPLSSRPAKRSHPAKATRPL